MFLYIGPGLGVGSIIILFIIFALVVFSFAMVLWIPLKKFIKKISNKKE